MQSKNIKENCDAQDTVKLFFNSVLKKIFSSFINSLYSFIFFNFKVELKPKLLKIKMNVRMLKSECKQKNSVISSRYLKFILTLKMVVILPFAVPAALAASIYLIRKQREYSWGMFSKNLLVPY